MLYNGDRKWTAPPRIEHLIERHDLLGDFGVPFGYFKIVENEFSRERLLTIRNLVSTLFLTETHYDLEALTQELLVLFDRETDKQAVSLLINWFRQMAAYGRIEEEDFSALSGVSQSGGGTDDVGESVGTREAADVRERTSGR